MLKPNSIITFPKWTESTPDTVTIPKGGPTPLESMTYEELDAIPFYHESLHGDPSFLFCKIDDHEIYHNFMGQLFYQIADDRFREFFIYDVMTISEKLKPLLDEEYIQLARGIEEYTKKVEPFGFAVVEILLNEDDTPLFTLYHIETQIYIRVINCNFPKVSKKTSDDLVALRSVPNTLLDVEYVSLTEDGTIKMYEQCTPEEMY